VRSGAEALGAGSSVLIRSSMLITLLLAVTASAAPGVREVEWGAPCEEAIDALATGSTARGVYMFGDARLQTWIARRTNLGLEEKAQWSLTPLAVGHPAIASAAALPDRPRWARRAEGVVMCVSGTFAGFAFTIQPQAADAVVAKLVEEHGKPQHFADKIMGPGGNVLDEWTTSGTIWVSKERTIHVFRPGLHPNLAHPTADPVWVVYHRNGIASLLRTADAERAAREAERDQSKEDEAIRSALEKLE